VTERAVATEMATRQAMIDLLMAPTSPVQSRMPVEDIPCSPTAH
jgi:hypothetical protein